MSDQQITGLEPDRAELAAATERRRTRSLDDLPRCAELVRIMERQLVVKIADLRHDGCTWQEIGDGIGISRQAAQQRFGKLFPAQTASRAFLR